MTRLPTLLLAAGLCAPLPLAGSDDTVNERIPVRPAELEHHWGIDCQRGWQALAQTGCALDEGQRHALRLCAMIYQPPGAAPIHRCPDYQRASALLQGCDSDGLRALIAEAGECPAAP